MIAARRRDPLRGFMFRLRLFDQLAPPSEATGGATTGVGVPTGYIAGVTRVSGLSATVQSAEIWSGGNSLHRYAHPDRCNWDPITLEQGLALDGILASWAQAAITYAATGAPPRGSKVKRGVILDVWDPYAVGPPEGPGGSSLGEAPAYPMYRYFIHNAWVSRYQALPQLDGRSNEVALLSLEVTHEGWRAEAVAPAEGTGPGGDETSQPGFPDLLRPFDDTGPAVA